MNKIENEYKIRHELQARASYYDKLGRIQWVGQMELPSNLTYSQVQDTINMADHKFPILKTHHQSQLTQLTHTIYDQAIDLGNQNFIQENLRNRVSASFRFDDYAAYQNYLSDPNNKENHIFTLYSYDEIGNVKRMANHTPRIVEGNNLWVDSKFKTIDYQYDLVSGNVNKVIYQKGKEDRFMHRYRYDADNRLEQVETSKDNVIWEKDAHYYYYPHGPLARIELGEHQVQGIDYYYTLQGWLKGINGKESNDPGMDGIANSPHATFPRDIFAMQLAYYQDDYKAIDNANANHLNNHWTHNLWNNHTDDVTQKNGLYNGNIAMQYTYLQPMQAGEQELVSHYRYDQLNRLKGAVGGFYDNNQLSATKSYKTEYSYDAMGNITHLKRQQGNTTYDSLRYYYEYNNVGIQTYNTGNQLLHNKLNRVQDLITSHNVANANDLPSGQGTDNYHYDSIGNLIHDEAEEIENIEWDVYGKITKIERTANSTKEDLVFKYDATGNRILKIAISKGQNATIRATSYHRDAQGNVLSTEESDAVPTSTTSPIPTTREYTLYGSSRLGVFKTYALGTTPQVGDYYMTKTDKYYELTNHLGNVMAVLSDAKHYDHNAQHFTTHTTQAQDYLPFGMLMPGRKYTNTSLVEKYRYTFNGQEQENELNPSITSALYWMYDGRTIRRWNVDPELYPWHGGYTAFNNNPIIYSDPLGNNPPTTTVATTTTKPVPSKTSKDFAEKVLQKAWESANKKPWVVRVLKSLASGPALAATLVLAPNTLGSGTTNHTLYNSFDPLRIFTTKPEELSDLYLSQVANRLASGEAFLEDHFYRDEINLRNNRRGFAANWKGFQMDYVDFSQEVYEKTYDDGDVLYQYRRKNEDGTIRGSGSYYVSSPDITPEQVGLKSEDYVLYEVKVLYKTRTLISSHKKDTNVYYDPKTKVEGGGLQIYSTELKNNSTSKPYKK